MSEDKKSFWTTLPGILTGFAAVISAVTGLVVALHGGDPTVDQQDSNNSVIEQPVKTNHAANGLSAHASVPPGERLSLKGIVDFSSVRFQDNNSVRSLMSWSDHYFREAKKAAELGGNLFYNCQKALQLRASAWCKQASPEIEKGLEAALKVCKVRGSLADWFNGG